MVDALGDPLIVVMKPKQKSPTPIDKQNSKGTAYEILCENENGQVMFLVGRLFPDGNLYVITAYWASSELQQIYLQEREVLQDE